MNPTLAQAPGAGPPHSDSSQGPTPIPAAGWLWALFVVWTLLIGLALSWNLAHVRQMALELARVDARSDFEKDIVYRQWATQHGGVYVPATEETPPNPYLAGVPERDLTTPSGRRLTLLNPAYMTRQVHELGRQRYGHQSHLTSLKPIRPENGPDSWERQTLEAFARGQAEVFSLQFLAGEQYLRLMRPLRTEAGCLKCHAEQGYREGDIRGGISVAVPMREYEAVARSHQRTELLAHGGIWAIGMVLLGVAGSQVQRRRRDRDRAQTALQESEARYRALFEHAPMGIVITDDQKNCLYLNAALCTMLGFERDELTRPHDSEVVTDRGIPQIQPALDALRAQSDSQRELQFQRKDGSMFTAEVKVTRMPDGRQVGMIQDITARLSMEEQLRQSQKLEAVGRLAGGVAHDFNNLLTVINGYSDLLLGRTSQPDPLRKPLEEIHKAGLRAAGLTRQLLAFSRKQVIEPQPVDLNELILDSRETLSRIAGEDIEFLTELDPQAGMVMADPGQLRQILMNLVVNARDAMPAGGRLAIRTARIELGPAETAAFPGASPGPYVVLDITDSGVGMSEEIRQNVFEPFYTTKADGAGTGLGLATVYGIVRQTGGWIRMESRLGMGTAFRVGLPLMAQSESPARSATQAASQLEGAETILVVEDQDEVRNLALAVLQSYGYPTLEARSGDEALAIAASYPDPIHLLLTDVVMPSMSGKELAARLHTIRPATKVLYMSGYTAGVISRQGRLEPGIELIEKPFSPRALAEAARKVLGQPRSPVRLLVVDDEEAIRRYFAQVLVGAGYEVDTACDGRQAEQALEHASFDLMLTDLVMPGREGLETIKAIRARQPRLKIIAVSGAFRGQFLPVAEKLGADATLAKPVGPEQLLKAVRETLGPAPGPRL